MTDEMKREDRELEDLWGGSWSRVERDLRSAGEIEAPVGLKHRIKNKEFGESRRTGRRRIAPITGAIAAAALCALLILRARTNVPSLDDLTDNDVIVIAEVLDSDEAISDLGLGLLDDGNVLDLTEDEV